MAALLAVQAAWGACDPSVVDIRWEGGSARFGVEVADSDAERQLGLMHRDHVPRDQGMLFVYDAPRAVGFWMKNTLVPLDMLFAGADGRVASIHENAVPLDTTLIPGGSGIQYVLEINGGLASQLGIGVGAELRHPAIGDDRAAWPCDQP